MVYSLLGSREWWGLSCLQLGDRRANSLFQEFAYITDTIQTRWNQTQRKMAISWGALRSFVETAILWWGFCPREPSERLGHGEQRRKEAKHYSRNNYTRNGKHHNFFPAPTWNRSPYSLARSFQADIWQKQLLEVKQWKHWSNQQTFDTTPPCQRSVNTAPPVGVTAAPWGLTMPTSQLRSAFSLQLAPLRNSTATRLPPLHAGEREIQTALL